MENYQHRNCGMLLAKRGKLLLGTPQRQNRVDAQHPSFAHMRTATQGSVSFFPFWWFKEKRELRYYILCINR